MIDLCRIKEDFSVLVKEAQPWTLTQFVMWLDLKLSEFKIKGYMVLGMYIYWIENERLFKYWSKDFILKCLERYFEFI